MRRDFRRAIFLLFGFLCLNETIGKESNYLSFKERSQFILRRVRTIYPKIEVDLNAVNLPGRPLRELIKLIKEKINASGERPALRPLEDYLSDMLDTKQIIPLDKVSKIKLSTSALEFLIDFSWLNDFYKVNGWDASVKLAMALELAHYLGLINIKDSPEITPKQIYEKLKLKEKIGEAKAVSTNWDDYLVINHYLKAEVLPNISIWQGNSQQVRFVQSLVERNKIKSRHFGVIATAIDINIREDLDWNRLNMGYEDVVLTRKAVGDLIKQGFIIFDDKIRYEIKTFMNNEGQIKFVKLLRRADYQDRKLQETYLANFLSAIEREWREKLNWTFILKNIDEV